MTSKRPKPGAGKPHPQPNQTGTQHNKCDVTGSIQVRGEIETTVPPDLAKKRDAADEKHEARDQLRFRVEVAGLVFIIIYAGLTAWQGYSSQISAEAARLAAKTAHDALVLENRPWVGLAGSSHLSAQIMKGSPITVHLEIQNVGKGPALNETSVGRLLARPTDVPMPSFERYSRNDAGPSITLMPDATAFVDVTTARSSDYG